MKLPIKFNFKLNILFFISLMLIGCNNNENEQIQEQYETEYATTIINEDYNKSLEAVGINQNNNLQYMGFALMINEYIYFADGIGIHKTDNSFENIETIVFNKDYEQYVEMNRTAFSHMQYHNDKIYFLNRIDNTIYSIDLYGNNITSILESEQIDEEGIIGGFIVVDDMIYFYFFEHHGMEMKVFNILNEEISVIDLEKDIIIAISTSPDKNYIHITYGNSLFAINLYDNTITNWVMPINVDLVSQMQTVPVAIPNRTNINGKLAFTTGSILNPRIYIIDENNYANEILYFENKILRMTLNSIDDFIYFIAIPQDRLSSHLYRIKYDGTNKELIFPYIAIGDPFIVMNIFSEDLIFFREISYGHKTKVLVRDTVTNELIRIELN